jgi:hypothetical protein
MLKTVGAIVPPATVITTARASTLPVARIRAAWLSASAANSAVSPRAVRALPPSRVTAMPPSSDPSPHRPSSGPGGGAASERVSGGGDTDFRRAKRGARRGQDRHEGRHRGGPQRSAEDPGNATVWTPGPRRELRGEHESARQHHPAAEDQRCAGRPDGPESERERRSGHERQLEHG